MVVPWALSARLKLVGLQVILLHGFGYRILAYDLEPHQEFAEQYGEYVALKKLLAQSDIISLHCPLTEDTYHLINNVIIRHQAFFTVDALNNIAETTLANITAIANNQPCPNQLSNFS